MELGTVGAVLRFAIELEGQSAQFYEEATSLANDSSIGEIFASLAEGKRKRKKIVERSRREFVNEMLLEPIVGLEGSDDLLRTELSSAMDSRAALQTAKGLEENSQALYVDAAEKISHLPQMARVFKKLGQGNAEHKLRLQSLEGVK